MDIANNDWESLLDPKDWGALREQGHSMLDDMFSYLQRVSAGSGPVWQPIPADVRHSIHEPLPVSPCTLDQAYGLFRDNVLPFSVGNAHPGFMGWVHGAGTPVGMLAEMLAAGLNSNLGGRDHMPVEVERQVVRWMSQLFAFPSEASGLFVTGSSMANLIGVLIARTRACGGSVRTQGVSQQPGKELVAYASKGAHGCIARAMDMAGLGSANLRLIEQGGDGAVDVQAMRQAIQLDLKADRRAFLIVGTAGSVDSGAIDNLRDLADLAAENNLHYHVDGAFGALCVLAPDLAHKVDGIERADSIAMDFHKWMHVPYDAGFVLVRSADSQLAAFADANQSYLAREPGGMSDGSPWPCDLGPDLSRGFRALKTWMTLKVYGTQRLGQAISESCERARYLTQLIRSCDELELMAPVSLNIVCFRYRSAEAISERVNSCLLLALQRSGIAAPSSTRISGRYAIRAALFNHRTSRMQLESLIDFVVIQGRSLNKGRA
ncbi:pyridoxal-dependent decarboxylase [Herbaspirillum sp. WKF16]|uniref:pyridoxal phosphate-dependent decarboxylase family protein n=1 Tax=Herbaspirillum sp. WKF16 TaxID=3028312 RepID=UPI0023A976F8|nr:pyridoxal-dependent decarboxylase [Herbaspirillum sp. WKF16]WDZ95810.1 pyridoxal-dependent decarboxylase [Herbaspirillum sp. WKF16]